ncbi:TPA: Cu(I)-responsive transcriptional regulator [Pseudomonas aeruginosa]|nr:Cu(I)-responsive transcriptional regulator [Pseudomonas aeruginosa]HBP6508742.1 Cu(I)-responsive transcriptional regulator [Pseudomonas aeruginosa]
MTRRPPKPELGQSREQGLHNIGEASALAAVSAKMIRHYESIGLIPEPPRTFAGYRLYSDSDVQRLQFIKRARTLGFSTKQIKELLSLWDDRSRASADVKRLANAHAAELAQRVKEMQAMQRTLETLVHQCQGDDRPGCTILDDLAQAKKAH